MKENICVPMMGALLGAPLPEISRVSYTWIVDWQRAVEIASYSQHMAIGHVA